MKDLDYLTQNEIFLTISHNFKTNFRKSSDDILTYWNESSQIAFAFEYPNSFKKKRLRFLYWI